MILELISQTGNYIFGLMILFIFIILLALLRAGKIAIMLIVAILTLGFSYLGIFPKWIMVVLIIIPFGIVFFKQIMFYLDNQRN